MRRLLCLAITLSAGAGATAGCDAGFPAGREPHTEFNFLDMADQPKMKPQRGDPMRVDPPDDAVAIDYYPYPYGVDQGDLAGRQLDNPLERSAENAAYGKWVFENVCIVCHGATAAGDGEVAKLFPKPPSLMTQKVRDWSDARIFHVPMRGQGSMPSYAKQLEQEDLWAVVLHLRQLQDELPVAPPDPNSSSNSPSAAGAGGATGAGGAAPQDAGSAGGARDAAADAGDAGGGGSTSDAGEAAADQAPAPADSPSAEPTAEPAAPRVPPPSKPPPPPKPEPPAPTPAAPAPTEEPYE